MSSHRRKKGHLQQDIIDRLAMRPALIEQLEVELRVEATEIGKELSMLVESQRVSANAAGAYTLAMERQARLHLWEGRLTAFEERITRMPAPHELDGDWRFSFSSVLDMLDLMMFALIPGARVCCLGTPSIAIVLDLLQLGVRVDLVDRNWLVLKVVKSETTGVRTIERDLLSPWNGRSYDIVFADPPWDGDYCSVFAQRALSILKMKGFGCLVSFPAHLRPAAPERQRKLVQVISSNEGRIVAIVPERIPIVPRFTAEPLIQSEPHAGPRTTGANGVVLIFQRVHARDSDADGWDLPIKVVWRRFGIAGSSWMLRDIEEEAGVPPVVRRLSGGGVVSRFHQIASKVDLWTSGDQVFQVAGFAAIRELLLALAENSTFDEAADSVFRACPPGVVDTRFRAATHVAWNTLLRVARREERLRAEFHPFASHRRL